MATTGKQITALQLVVASVGLLLAFGSTIAICAGAISVLQSRADAAEQNIVDLKARNLSLENHNIYNKEHIAAIETDRANLYKSIEAVCARLVIIETKIDDIRQRMSRIEARVNGTPAKPQ